jgi:hypothetical protein
MGRKKAMDSREVGLVMGLAAGKYFFGSDDLHYGLWTDDLPVKPEISARRRISIPACCWGPYLRM